MAPSLHSFWSFSPLISSCIVGTDRPGEFIFQCPIFLPFHTVHGVSRWQYRSGLLFPSNIFSELPTMTMTLCVTYFTNLYYFTGPYRYLDYKDIFTLKNQLILWQKSESNMNHLFMEFSRQEYWSGLPFPSPMDHILSDFSTITHCFVWPHTAWLSFIDLDKAVVRVIRVPSCLWLWFQSVCPLMPFLSAYLLTWVSLTLDVEYLFSAAPAKHSHCSLSWTWGNSSRLLPLTLDISIFMPKIMMIIILWFCLSSSHNAV